MAKVCGRQQVLLGAILAIATALPLWQTSAASSRRLPVRTRTDQAGSTLRFQLVAGRILLTVGMTRPDGAERKVLAWLNMGTPKLALSPDLARDLDAASGRQLIVKFGDETIPVAPDIVDVRAPELDGEDVLVHLFAPLPVEATLPASVLQRYQLVLDFPAREVTLAQPGTRAPEGVATPMRVNPGTGIATVEALVAGEPHRLAIDAGASFTWLRGNLVKGWLAEHPEWRRADGAVGVSNMGLTRLAFERDGTLVRLPDTLIAGRLKLPEIEALGTAPLICDLCDRFVGDLFWEGWEHNAPAPVAGWIGNNVLGDFRLIVDYPNRTLYWLRIRDDASHTINEVGVTLVRQGRGYVIGGLVRKNDAPAVAGVQNDDRLIAIDDVAIDGRSSDDVLKLLGGSAGAHHKLSLERGGDRMEVEVPVTEF